MGLRSFLASSKTEEKTEEKTEGRTEAEILSALETMRSRHKWSGQSHCAQCGQELKIEQVSHRRDYDPFSGLPLGKSVKVMWCEQLEFVWGSIMTRYPASAQSLWDNSRTMLSHHDYWFLEP